MKRIVDSKLQIEWGNLNRTKAIEDAVKSKAKKILSVAPGATHLIVHFHIENPMTSSGVPEQSVSMELRLPHNRDIRSEKTSRNLYKAINETQKALFAQLEYKKNKVRVRHKPVVYGIAG